MNNKKHSVFWYFGVVFVALVLFSVFINIGNSSKTTTSSKELTSNNQQSSRRIWKLGYFVDDFGDYTKDKYLKTSNQYGSFSNSATTNSNLKWNLLVTRQYIAFFLYEYGSSQVKGFSSFPDTYKVSIKEDNGAITSFDAKNGSDRIMISNSSDYQKFLAILNKEREVKISIQETGLAASSSYNLGVLDCAGFGAEFKEL